MARAALGWSLNELAKLAGVNKRTIIRHEAGQTISSEKLEAMRATLVREGIEFINGGRRAGVAYQRRD